MVSLISILDRTEFNIREYERGQQSLEHLQTNIETTIAALDGPETEKLVEGLSDFAEEIELVLFVAPRRKWLMRMAPPIGRLRSTLDAYRMGAGKSAGKSGPGNSEQDQE